MKQTKLMELGAEVRKQGGQGAGMSMKDLVYDIDTGEFVQGDKRDVVPANCDIVTEMTRDGFANHG